MSSIEREDIHIISRHSNLSPESIDTLLKNNVYSSRQDWRKFLRLFFISLGVGFTTIGILFFFAYNWADLHKFIKIGLVEAGVIILTCIVLFTKIRVEIKNIFLTGASVLVGVLFAVFGQIYQTGANAFDFFLAWMVFIMLWVFIANFAPLWLIFITLINTTFILYTEQVAEDWSVILVFTLLYVLNGLILVFFLITKDTKIKIDAPDWSTNIMTFTAVTFGTMGIIAGIFDKYETIFPVLVILVIVTYSIGVWYGLLVKRLFYLAVISLSVICIISTLIIKISSDYLTFFIVSLFIVASVTLVIKQLIALQKKWNHG